MPKRNLLFLVCFLPFFYACDNDDILLSGDTYTRVKIKYENLPDFSFAGYEKSEKSIPQVAVRVTISPKDGDDAARIQKAIDSVSALPAENGFRGAVLLKAGTYQVKETLYIRASGVVLRGEGQGENGTVIIATSRGRAWNPQNLQELVNMRNFSLIRMEGNASCNVASDIVAITASSIPVGATRIPVANSAAFQKGDTIIIEMLRNDKWINVLKMAQLGWTAEEYQVAHRRVVKNTDEDAVYIDIPLVEAIEKKYGGGYIAKVSLPGRISNSGIENLCLKSVYANDDDEAHMWTAVRLSDATNSWVRNVTARHFAFGCVTIFGWSDFNTIQDCAMLDPKSLITGNRRYSFYIEGGMGNLFQRCYSRGGRHDFGTGARVTGPNVFLDSYATNSYHETGPHHRWATGILYDNVQADIIKAYNRANQGNSRHGWAGVQNMFWNCKATRGFRIESPPNGINWCIGCRGGGSSGNGYWASWGIPVLPRSLFLHQLSNRLGAEAVRRITIPSQRGNANMWEELDKWAADL